MNESTISVSKIEFFTTKCIIIIFYHTLISRLSIEMDISTGSSDITGQNSNHRLTILDVLDPSRFINCIHSFVSKL